jgi:two-component system chemotaxis sensor kinase CheA
MLQQIKRLFREAADRAAEEQTRLEALVRLRTQALEDRNADMRRVLDNVEQGFLTMDRAGTMSRERSAIVERWLGPAPASGSFFEYIDRVVPGLRTHLEVSWAQVTEGVLPIEITLDQMPRRFQRGDQHFAIDYRPILSDGRLEGAVVVLSDVTPIVEKERAETEQREALHLFTYLSEDRAGVAQFFAEAARLVDEIVAQTPSDPRITKRLVHTLKGNAALFGMERLSQVCHEIEDALAESSGNVGPLERRRLAETWAVVHDQLSHFVEDSSAGLLVSTSDYAELRNALAACPGATEVIGLVESWRLEPTRVRLERAARQARSLAERLGKGPIEVHVEANQLRLDPERWSPIWTELPHLIRNAIDHGLEPREERIAHGKSEVASLWLRTLIDGSRFVIEVQDSGRGVDWERVRSRAEARGLPARTLGDLERALFADGISTKETAGETSGRGIGMSAVKAAVQASGGHVQLQSQLTQGTLVRLSWPAGAMSSTNACSIARPELHQGREAVR